MANPTSSENMSMTLETATACARSNRDWDKVREHLRRNPRDFFAISQNRRWSIAHQIVYHNKTEELKRILGFFSDDEIDITTKSGDNRTLLCIATEKKIPHPNMFEYVSLLFKQNELITAAKKGNWQLVNDLLENDKELANEKPPYSSYFLIHYVIKNGDGKILQDFIKKFQLKLNLLNKNKETPLDMAAKLGRQDMCTILRRAQGIPEPEVPSNPSTPTKTGSGLRPLGFSAIANDLMGNNDESNLINTAYPASKQVTPRQNSATTTSNPRSPSSPLSPPMSSDVKHVRAKKTIVKEVSCTDTDLFDESASPPPSPLPSITDLLSKRLTCPLTHKLFVDPVIGDDGYTYERSAISQRIKTKRVSPKTNKPMADTFHENKLIEQLTQLLKNQN